MAEMPTNGQTPKVDTFPTESQSLSEDIADQQFDITMPTNVLSAMPTFTDQHQSGIKCCGVVSDV
jgi:hypothetical protein